MTRSPCKPVNASNRNKLWTSETKETGSPVKQRKVSVNRALPLIADKENTDPLTQELTTAMRQTPTKSSHHLQDQAEPQTPKAMEFDDGDAEQCGDDDGFVISDEFQLDDPNMDGISSHGENSQHPGNGSDKDCSPFVLSSLLNNRVMGSKLDSATKLKLLSGEEGSSPALETVKKVKPPLDFSTPEPSSSRSGRPVKFRRSISMVERPTTTLSSPELLKQPISAIPDFTSPVSRTGFKRPGPPLASSSAGNVDNNDCKKLKLLDGSERCGKLVRSVSQTVGLSPTIAHIMHACSLSDKPNMTSDRSCKLSLPTIQGASKNHDLNNIDCHVMAKLINGDFADKVASFRVIDARYSYEYEGGHIRGAENFGMWDEKAFLDEFFPESLGPKASTAATELDENESAVITDRSILIFHCEFSSARGPALLRALRKKDRELNKNTYPALHYPECYLLHDGYKMFYSNYPQLCDPQSYVPMKHPEFISEERKFHKRARTWAGGAGGANTVTRTGSSSRLLKL